MYRVTETGKRAKNVDSIDTAVVEANKRIADWPTPFNDMRRHHQFADFKRWQIDVLAIRSADASRTIEITRAL